MQAVPTKGYAPVSTELSGNSKTAQLESELQDVIKLAQKNAEKAAHRDHDLHDTERQTEDLEKAAGIYNAKAEQARRKMWWKDMKVKVLVAVIVLVLLVGITLGVLNQIGVLSLFGGSRPTAAPSP